MRTQIRDEPPGTYEDLVEMIVEEFAVMTAMEIPMKTDEDLRGVAETLAGEIIYGYVVTQRPPPIEPASPPEPPN